MKKQLHLPDSWLLAMLLLLTIPFLGYGQKKVTTYYDYKQTKIKEVYYTDNYGTKNGSYTQYSEYGGILSQATYKNGTQVGKWTVKDEKGVLLYEYNYDNGGLLNGLSTNYNNGHKENEGNYMRGNTKVGHWKTWYTTEDGQDAYKQLKDEDYYYKNGVDSLHVEYFLSGKIQKRSWVDDSNVKGESQTYNEAGILVSVEKHPAVGIQIIESFNNDGSKLSMETFKQQGYNTYQTGECIYYDRSGSGKVMAQGMYGDNQYGRGIRVGRWKIATNVNLEEVNDSRNTVYYKAINYDTQVDTTYYATGEVEFVGHITDLNMKRHFPGGYPGSYQSDYILDGHCTTYYQNGKMMFDATYNRGRQVGVAKGWDKDGNMKTYNPPAQVIGGDGE